MFILGLCLCLYFCLCQCLINKPLSSQIIISRHLNSTQPSLLNINPTLIKMQSSLHCYQTHSVKGSSHRPQIQSHIEQSIPLTIKTRSSIKKVIRLLNNLLKMNMFECALLCWLLKKSGPALQQRLNEFSDEQLQEVNVVTEDYEKRLLLILLLNGYHVKSNFLANGSQLDIDPNIIETIKNFRIIYRQWKPQKSIKNISLTQIHQIFEQWNSPKTKLTNNKIDYNKIVDKILFLSKTYNVVGNDDGRSLMTAEKRVMDVGDARRKDQKGSDKKRKVNEHLGSQSKLNIRYCEEKEIGIENSPMKNSFNKMQWFEDERNNEPLRRSTRTVNRSIFELRDDRYDMNPNQSLFRSIRSQQSDNNMFGTLRNTSNRFFNANGSFVGMNNQSIVGNGFVGSLQSDGDNNMRRSVKSKGDSKGKGLKPTSSYEDMLK